MTVGIWFYWPFSDKYFYLFSFWNGLGKQDNICRLKDILQSLFYAKGFVYKELLTEAEFQKVYNVILPFLIYLIEN